MDSETGPFGEVTDTDLTGPVTVVSSRPGCCLRAHVQAVAVGDVVAGGWGGQLP